MRKPIVISISNHKGGVGKTTTTVNLGAALARRKRKTLVIDLDPQSNLTKSLGITRPERTIYDSLSTGDKLRPLEVEKGLDLIPSTLDLSGVEIELSGEAGREMILSELVNPQKRNYEFILIDCPPSLGLLTLNALVASDVVIIPLQTQFLAMEGLAKLKEIISKVKSRLNKKIKLGGIVFTQYDGRKNLHRETVEEVERAFKGRVFKTKIRDNVSLGEAPSWGKSIFNYSINSNGAKDYSDFCLELLRWKRNRFK